MAEEPAIIYSVKELISRLDGKLDALMNLMTNKADRADVIALEHRLTVAQTDLDGMKTREQEREKLGDKSTLSKRFIAGLLVAIITGLLGASISLIEILTHK